MKKADPLLLLGIILFVVGIISSIANPMNWFDIFKSNISSILSFALTIAGIILVYYKFGE